MKKIIKILIVWFLAILSIAMFTKNTYADPKTETETETASYIYVTEKVPWVDCVPAEDKNKKWQYKCKVERGFWAIMTIMWNMIKYFTFISGLLAVLTIVVWWIAYSMWWADDAMKTKSKEFIKKSLMWLIILLLSWTILYAIAPWVYN